MTVKSFRSLLVLFLMLIYFSLLNFSPMCSLCPAKLHITWLSRMRVGSLSRQIAYLEIIQCASRFPGSCCGWTTRDHRNAYLFLRI